MTPDAGISIPIVQLVPITKLRPAPWNPRLLSSERFKNLCQSLQADPDFLARRPILANAEGVVMAGNMRLRAAEKLGWRVVPAILEDVSEQVAKERALRDNSSWGSWEDDQLGEMLAELKDLGSDVASLGFDDKQLQALMAGGAGPPDLPAGGGELTGGIDVIEERWQVLVACPSETQQRELLDELNARGLECRALIT